VRGKRLAFRLDVKRRGCAWSFTCEHESLPLVEHAARDELKKAEEGSSYCRIRVRLHVPKRGEYLEDPECANENGEDADFSVA
jgi:hypothetical protein